MRKLSTGKLFAALALSTVLCLIVYAMRDELDPKTYYDFLLWNLFLAWIPYALSTVGLWLHERSLYTRAYSLIPIGIVWLLFLPNSPYIVTDLIHLTILKNNYITEGWYKFTYWYDMISILLFAWNGLLLAFVSMYQWQSIVTRRFTPLISWLFIGAVSFLSAYGVLLGREYRFNSWDVLSQMEPLTRTVLSSLQFEPMMFCALFGVLLLAIYSMLYVLLHSGEDATRL
ncbi:DUF1361 domain-containing protein [Paenibacillus sp. YYML68]|uniref:DUF1361 domain-containing protein n=1 Tax=Paenibacillus sp. YYML68 TaxID=2909250 RepID=UPI0024918466|nr:DUF1361 domain-containing protein [Paenibacillus sp. YYML68]